MGNKSPNTPHIDATLAEHEITTIMENELRSKLRPQIKAAAAALAAKYHIAKKIE